MTLSADKLLRPTWAEISLSALQRNYERVRALAGHRRVMAVVKADAYGHGAVPVSQRLARCGVDWFGVATAEEAVELRDAGITQPILLLGGLYMSDPVALIEYNLVPSVSSTSRLDTYAECARRHNHPIALHLKVDTGLGRLGVPLNYMNSFLEHYQKIDGLRLEGIFTHLASSHDLVALQTEEQLERFHKALTQLPWFDLEPTWIHVSNSAALLLHRETQENLVRIGALLYGYCVPFVLPPGRKIPDLPQFEPILSLKSRVVYLKDVPSGTPLGYGASFYTRRPSRIATVPVGYADGLSRALSNRGHAIINDQYCGIVGSISMDLTLLDVTDIPGVEVGSEVTLIGKSESCAISALEIAAVLNTVPYEVLCSIGKRVPRLYLD
jgi:alanine racemase